MCCELQVRPDAHVLIDSTIFYFVDMQNERKSEKQIHGLGFGNHGGICAICLDKIVLQETALVKGCEHAYWFV